MKHKFFAKPQTIDEKWFGSKLESKYYQALKFQVGKGLLFFLRQVPFELPGKVKYIVDFVEFWENGDVIFTDVKGRDTTLSLTKRKMVEELYPIVIKIVSKI